MTRGMGTRGAGICGALAVGALALACGSTPPAGGTYTIAFQSTAEAVALAGGSVRVMVFDASAFDGAEVCGELLALRASHQDLPPAIVDLPAASTCALAKGGSFTAPFGSVAVLVLGQMSDDDLVRGCATQRLSADVTSITVEVALVSGKSIPPTTCASLSQKCSGGC